MGFPGSEEGWSSLAGGAIFPGLGSAMPGIWSVVAIVACVAVLAIGNAYEKKRYKNQG